MATHLVTGAGSGIGAAVTRRLVDRGDEVVLLVRDESRGEELRSRFAGVQCLVADLDDPRNLAASLAAQDLPDRLDSLVHVAGVVELGPVGELSAEVWRSTLDVNLLAPAELTRLLLPALRAAHGHVVFVNSSAVFSSHEGWAAYTSSKSGLLALADALRAEEKAHRVRVTSVFPGRTATPMQEKVHAQEGKAYDAGDWIDPNSVATTILAALDLPRDAELTDLRIRPTPH